MRHLSGLWITVLRGSVLPQFAYVALLFVCVCVFFPLSASTLRTTINQRGNSGSCGSLKAACSTLYVCVSLCFPFVLYCICEILLYLSQAFHLVNQLGNLGHTRSFPLKNHHHRHRHRPCHLRYIVNIYYIVRTHARLFVPLYIWLTLCLGVCSTVDSSVCAFLVLSHCTLLSLPIYPTVRLCILLSIPFDALYLPLFHSLPVRPTVPPSACLAVPLSICFARPRSVKLFGACYSRTPQAH